ncbi:sensor histidine kinase [Plesiocystis pacifica SIR-1]|uniref:histidine kinase n=1 Tax=Plesiocystis pacifica SIR-1 TaxID=391625 RepID=A6G4K4_9BACT|nr:AAA family ATPase [Plesiocystis pacifica]EDM79124.1 sensor histidine kinase [Plesiocystis pacifica SIR-1]
MALNIDGLRPLKLLSSTAHTQVWSAEREADGLEVVAKVFSLEGQPGVEARVEHEFEQLTHLDVPGVVRALSLERSGHEMVLVLAAHQGVNLSEHRGERVLPVSECLEIAIQLTTILDAVHRRGVLHRDIKPTNVLIDPSTGEVALADFGISVLLQNERRQLHDMLVVEGTLPYMAPEQTGRTGRSVDYRSDLYALGVTLYELLAGRRPFPADSALELIHAHLARKPSPPLRARPDLPRILSDLVMKLLEKAPERRYQSAAGLLADLLEIRARLGRGQNFEDLRLGHADVPLTLQLSQVLYGRETQRAALAAEFEHVRREASPRLAVIVGESGVGKSALCGELTETVHAVRGFMTRGRFDDGLDQHPFSAFVGALEDLADQLLTLPEEALERWRKKLASALIGYVPIILEFAPRFRPLLDYDFEREQLGMISVSGSGEDTIQRTLEWVPNQVAPELAPAEARNRIEVACARLIACFARPEHPLVLVLENLQWSDPGSLNLLHSIFGEDQLALLVATTARPEALEDGHPTLGLLAKLRSAELEPALIELAPLERPELERMLSDLLSRPVAELGELTGLVLRKTGGNPHFVQQFLVHLSEQDLLTHSAQGWRWQAEAIARASLPDDFLGMLTAKLERIGEQDPELRELLSVASVFGTEFEATALERVAASERVEVELHRLTDEGLLSALGGHGYAFSHPRVREAAYRCLSPDKARSLHLAVGRDLQLNLDEEALNRRIFEVADHLNRGYALTGTVTADSQVLPLLDDIKLERLASINLAAGRRALLTGAPGSASAYLDVARSLATLLSPDFPGPGEANHALSYEIELRSAQVEALVGKLQRADELFEALSQRALELAEYGEIAIERAWVLNMAGQPERSLEQALDVVRRLGVKFPREPSPTHMLLALPRIAWNLREASVVRWRNMAPCTDPAINVAIDILFATTWTSYAAAPVTFSLAVERAGSLILRHGDHELAPNIFALMAMVHGNAFNKRERARELVVQARQIIEARAVPKGVHNILQLEHFLQLWKLPLHRLSDQALELFELGLAAGDVRSAAYSSSFAVELGFYAGIHLEVVQRRFETRQRWLDRWGLLAPSGSTIVQTACVRLTKGPPPSLDESRGLERPEHAVVQTTLVHGADALVESLVYSVFERWREVLILLEDVPAELIRTIPGTWHGVFAAFFQGLAASSLALELHASKVAYRRELVRVTRQNVKRLRRVVAQGGNFEMLLLLLEGQLACLDGRLSEAGPLYLQAATIARKQRNPMLEALTHERTAKLGELLDIPAFSDGPLERARERYLHWGAFAKVEELDSRRPALRESPAATERGLDSTSSGRIRTIASASISTSSGLTSHSSLDAATLLEASRALSEDIRLAEVVERILGLAIENAGAERGALILSEASELHVVAEAHGDGQVVSHVEAPLSLSAAAERLPASLLRWVERTNEATVFADITSDSRFASDPYLHNRGSRAVLCTPLLKQGNLVGLLYLENRLHTDAFTRDRLETMRVLASQAAAALENARLYDDLRASEIRWRSLVEQLPDYVVMAGREGRVDLVNPGRNPEQLPINRALRKLVKAGREDPQHPLSAVLDGLGEQTFEQAITTNEGERRWLDVRVAPLSVDGQIERALLVATEVTERKRAEAQREHLEAQLRQQQRLESIGTLAGGVAHEINNPVQGIMNYAELIAGSSAADELIREFAQEIDHETQRVATIVRNLLAFAREDQDAAFTEVTPKSVVDAPLSLIRALIRRDQIQIDLEIAEDLPKVRCRAQQIQQVVMNLVTNARDALNGRFTGFHDDKRMLISGEPFTREGQPWLRLSVADSGGGVPQDVSLRIFDPFFTTKGRDRGTGLGLSVSHGIISDHGGELRLVNRPGEGATFIIELPIAGPEADAGEPSSAAD